MGILNPKAKMPGITKFALVTSGSLGYNETYIRKKDE